ncbi:MAG: type I-B CRISPR-associated protein Cas5 [Armatimonadetes bacterium]|nr:type I-B CRISPR-associated protein Cas5 [Armatimonadota bacterium]
MRVLRVEFEAATASFRYPHFMVGRHPTFPMPPPATLYGLVCAAVGDYVPPETLRLGFRFTYEAEACDLEHLHIITPKGARAKFDCRGQKLPLTTEGTVTPTTRDFLFNARLTLYINRLDLADAFRRPYYAMSLGRSQDLATIGRIDEVELHATDCAYVEHTLLPAEERLWLGSGIVLTLPRFVDPRQAREPRFDHYLMLRERIYAHQGLMDELRNQLGDQLVRTIPAGRELWADPDTQAFHGAHRAVWLQELV